MCNVMISTDLFVITYAIYWQEGYKYGADLATTAMPMTKEITMGF